MLAAERAALFATHYARVRLHARFALAWLLAARYARCSRGDLRFAYRSPAWTCRGYRTRLRTRSQSLGLPAAAERALLVWLRHLLVYDSRS